MLSLYEQEKQSHIKFELSKVHPCIFHTDRAVILCPFHDDTNPSLNVSLVSNDRVSAGGFHCWSCGAHGGWNKLASQLKLSPWGKEEREKYEKDNTIDKFQILSKMFAGDLIIKAPTASIYKKPVTEGLWDEPWRGIPLKVLHELEIEKYYSDKYDEFRPFIPVRDSSGTLIGHILARKDNSRVPNEEKYLNSTNFPSRYAWLFANKIDLKKHNCVVLVEGPFDAIRLWSYDIPALAILGVNTFLGKNGEISPKVPSLVGTGVKHFVIMFDADKAGVDAAPLLYQELIKYGLTAINFDLRNYRTDFYNEEEKIDAGNAPEAALDVLKQYLKSYAATS